MRKSIYKIVVLNGEKLKEPIEVTIEQMEDKRWKASTGASSATSNGRNECFQKLIKVLETPKAKTKALK
jgi:hypothetical protein